MSDVLYDEWDRAYEEGREAGRKEAWNGDYDYAYLVSQAESDGRRRGWNEALDAARKSVEIVPPSLYSYRPDESLRDVGIWKSNVLAAIDALREEQK